MLKHYLKINIRNLVNKKAFTLINILGFAFGISVCLIIVLFIAKERNYDQYHTNADHIFKLIDSENNSSSIDYRVKDILLNNYPEVKNGCLVHIVPTPVATKFLDNGYYIDNMMSVDNAFFEMFTVPFVYKSAALALPDLNSVVLTESASRKLFGDENPIGRAIVIREQNSVIVSGVIRDFPVNSSIQANIIVNAENNDFKFSFTCSNYQDVSTHRYPFRIYLQLAPKTNLTQLIEKINEHAEAMAPFVSTIDLLSLKKLYLYDKTNGSDTKRGNPLLLRLLASIAVIVFLLAIINYINLTVAQQSQRNKETGIRKTFGAKKGSLVFLFLNESMLVTLVAFIGAIFITNISLPLFNEILDSSISLWPLMRFPANIILLLAVLLLGIISGLVPALILSSFSPLKAINGQFLNTSKRTGFKNLLTVFQFIVSIVLLFCLIVIEKQINYVKHQNLGFNKDQLVRLDIPRISNSDVSSALGMVNEFKQYPNIINLSITNGAPGNINMFMGSGAEGKEESFACILADSSFIKTFDIQVIMGRQLLPGDYGEVCMINEAAYKYLEWQDLENKIFDNGRREGFKVIGVVKDFHFASMHNKIEPLCILFRNMSPNCLNLRIAQDNIGQTMDYIRNTWKKCLPDYPLKYQFYDDWYDNLYRKEEKFAKAIGLFAVLAMSISCMGILGLAIYTLKQRTRELGIRKVLGASISGLVIMLSTDLSKSVLLANLIAWPIAWYAMHQWLQNFAYRIDMSLWIFVMAGALALVVALLTISWQVIRAAMANPVESLRYE